MSQLTKKAYQRKALFIGLSIFGAVALIATGFAAWLISSTQTRNEAGNIHIGTVSDQGITITIKEEDQANPGHLTSDCYFAFEPKEGDTTGRVRADTGENADTEKLGFTLSGTLNPYDFVSHFTYRLDILNHEGKVDTAAMTRFFHAANEVNPNVAGDALPANSRSYITLPACFGRDIEIKETSDASQTLRVVKDETTKTEHFTLPIFFGWGSFFGNENPSLYYDDNALSGDISDADMKTQLVDFYRLLSGVSTTDNQDISAANDAAQKTFRSLTFRITLTADTSNQSVADSR